MSQVIAARYELIDVLGRGGMGAVWRARDTMLGREVAIKEVALPQGLDEAQVERIQARTLREARSAARLHHPGIVTVFDVVEEDGRPWIVMQLVRAPALDRVLAQDGPLPPARVASIGLDLLDALRAAHAAGVTHRDVKPGNVLLPGGRAVLTDFGIATMEGDQTLTQSGAIVGSPAYLAPEQARRGRATPASDLWSLGATLYAAVEGRPPFQRDDVWGLMAALLTDEPDPVRLAGPLTPVLHGLLHKDPDERLSPGDAERLLREAVGSGPGWSPPQAGLHPGARNATLPPPPPLPSAPAPSPDPTFPGPSSPARRRARWNLIVPAGIFAVALVAAVVAVLVFVDGAGDPSGRTPSPSAGSAGSGGAASAPAGGAASVPAGYEEYRGPSFVAAVPRGWKAEPEGRDVTFRDPAPDAARGIAFQRIAGVTGNEARWLSDAAKSFKNSSDYPDYEEIAFRENIPFQGANAAELEFTFTKDGRPGRVRDRLFSFNGGLYQALLIAGQRDWDASTRYFDTFLSTFRAP
ncbi:MULTISPECIES: serine/threonine-protein kinase [Thermomonosporaceae]|uniref:serine/threonine-protein kinase n=1 Tax=Thermomonosporaceae TaxID=2012 RepID=UPI00255AE1D1|nr:MULTISPECIES: serine/threonine-protein kinase [Thermomonosporaceae]MDL4771998.1 serine/threonine-protein kinase [Actinomadura xylanilytica]